MVAFEKDVCQLDHLLSSRYAQLDQSKVSQVSHVSASPFALILPVRHSIRLRLIPALIIPILSLSMLTSQRQDM